jgi:carbamoyltransferase
LLKHKNDQNMNILSINFNHDGAGVILSNGRVNAFVNTERFSRIKKHPGIREDDIDNLLEQAGLNLEDIDLVIFCNLHNMDSSDIPFIYGTDLKETWFDHWIRGTTEQVSIRGKIFPSIINPDHHLTHCSLAYYTSSFKSGVAFSWDPTGFGAFACKGNKIEPIEIKLHYNASTIYTTVSKTLFNTGLFGAGKVMGLAPYGYKEAIDNSINDNRISNPKSLLDEAKNNPVWLEEKDNKWNARLAYNVQRLMEEQLDDVLDQLYAYCLENDIELNLCLSGGGALNSVANQIAFGRSKFKNIFLHPACGDDGTAIGAALWYWYNEQNNPRLDYTNADLMYSVKNYESSIKDALINPEFKNKITINRTKDYINQTAQLISEGKIIGWFQGASELGPRALGNRSIIADPRHPDMKDILNSKVKFREGFRPFAPSVLNEHAEEWFGLKDSPFMLRVSKVLKPGLPSITHVDNTARIQTVKREDNNNYYDLINSFYKRTQVPLVIDTSFNIKGEPIVETPEDALKCFLGTGIDYLVFPELIISKK